MIQSRLACALSLMLGSSMALSARAQVNATPTAQSTASRDNSTVVSAVMQRRIALHLEHVTLKVALRAVAQAARISVTYSADALPVDKRVSLVTDQISVEDALHVLLDGTDLEAAVVGSGTVTIRPTVAPTRTLGGFGQQGSATISGYVRDSATGSGIPQVTVRVDATNLTTQSGADGRFTLSGIPAGEYHVSARRVGYVAKAQVITLAEGEAKTLDFALNPPATKLDEVVTTALGEQRRYAVGNVISTINVDSIAPTAPVTSVTDLISARAPGVEVMENSGLVGSGETIRIRGVSSMVLQGDPIVIVDGVRQDNAAGGYIGSRYTVGGYYSTPSRINDINFSDIETIDILKGPAASTEYGTDAASGVIVITTKHGSSGQAVWHGDAEQTSTGIGSPFPHKYNSWGHYTDGTDNATPCTLTTIYGTPASTLGDCVVDSITEFNPLNNKTTTMVGTGARQKYDLSVSGGSDAVRYFFAGAMSGDRGVLHMPEIFRSIADAQGVILPAAAYKANTEDQRSVRLNTAMKLNSSIDLSADVSYLTTQTMTPDVGFLLTQITNAPAIDDLDNGYGYGGTSSSPLGLLTNLGSDHDTRTAGGATLKWRPMGWLVGSATVGLDHGSEGQQAILYPTVGSPTGALFSGDGTNDIYTIDLRLSATAAVMHDVQAVTSAGLQMEDTRSGSQSAQVYGITSSNLTLDGYGSGSVSQQTNDASTLGGYGEEQLSFRDRLFLIGALRLDAASGFGSAYTVAAYPKASLSWLALNGGRTTVRVRAAWGEAGNQPENGASELLRSATAVYQNGGVVSGEHLSWPGNPNLRPERSEEYEGGVDIGGWGNRVSLEFTVYKKVTHDALANDMLSGDVCCYTYQENLGEVANDGIEGSATFGVIQTRDLLWEVSLNASVNHNKLVSLAPNVTISNPYFGGYQQNRVGYPLFGLWGDPMTYSDANHDGIIEPNEVSSTDSARYLGPGAPTQEASLSTHVGLWRGALTFSGLLDAKGGYRIDNEVALYLVYGSDASNNLIQAPLWEKARAMLRRGVDNAPTAMYFEDGSFIRLREISATYAVPRSVLRHFRIVETLALTAAVRNLALWTRYTGSDPEVNDAAFNGNNTSYNTPSGNATINNDYRSDNGSIPLLRDWVLRLNVGLK